MSFEGGVVKAIYFFAGEKRKGSIAAWLQMLCEQDGLTLQLTEWDTLTGGEVQDLTVKANQEYWCNKLKDYHVVISTPPCNTHSRATWANSLGPHPLRSASYPDGWPWAEGHDLNKLEEANSLVAFTWQVLEIVDELRQQQCIVGLGEHPEDLGRVRGRGPYAVPASIWRSPERQRLTDKGWWSGAVRQCDFEAPTPKPTRFIASSQEFKFMAKDSLPYFDEEGFYLGPIEVCDHDHEETLIRKPQDTGPFRTGPSATYTSSLCRMLAICIMLALKAWTPSLTLAKGCKVFEGLEEDKIVEFGHLSGELQ